LNITQPLHQVSFQLKTVKPGEKSHRMERDRRRKTCQSTKNLEPKKQKRRREISSLSNQSISQRHFSSDSILINTLEELTILTAEHLLSHLPIQIHEVRRAQTFQQRATATEIAILNQIRPDFSQKRAEKQEKNPGIRVATI
jgi:hypothetical protein